MTSQRTSGLILSDFSIGALKGYLENAGGGESFSVRIAPFDQVAQVLLQHDHECWSPIPQFVVLWSRPERVSPSFGKALAGERVSETEVVAEVEAFYELVSGLQQPISHCFLPEWVLTLPTRGLGLLDWKTEMGIAYLLGRMNVLLAQRFSTSSRFYVLPTSRWIQEAGKWAYSPKGWYVAKAPFGAEVLASAAKDIRAAVRALGGKTKKLLVLDLDDTIWGGILGEVGWQNLVIGGHDPLGEAYADLQRELRSLRQRGILLAIASKNDEGRALEALTSHPEMVLKKEDFVTWRINWNDKAQNLADIVSELNLGLDSVVFLDDNPVERSRVREALPEVLVPELPDDKLLLASYLRKQDYFDQAQITNTDQARTQLYHAERDREALRSTAQSLDDWLEKLETRLAIHPLNPADWDRALQLLNKTNQMNLSTRRLSDSELRAWLDSPSNRFWVVRVADRFGDAGPVGLVSLSVQGHRARITDFVLSCRVMGRQIEEAMLWKLLNESKRLGVTSVEAEYLPTARNSPCLKFLERAGGQRQDNLFQWSTARIPAPPSHIRFGSESL